MLIFTLAGSIRRNFAILHAFPEGFGRNFANFHTPPGRIRKEFSRFTHPTGRIRKESCKFTRLPGRIRKEFCKLTRSPEGSGRNFAILQIWARNPDVENSTLEAISGCAILFCDCLAQICDCSVMRLYFSSEASRQHSEAPLRFFHWH